MFESSYVFINLYPGLQQISALRLNSGLFSIPHNNYSDDIGTDERIIYLILIKSVRLLFLSLPGADIKWTPLLFPGFLFIGGGVRNRGGEGMFLEHGRVEQEANQA